MRCAPCKTIINSKRKLKSTWKTSIKIQNIMLHFILLCLFCLLPQGKPKSVLKMDKILSCKRHGPKTTITHISKFTFQYDVECVLFCKIQKLVWFICIKNWFILICDNLDTGNGIQRMRSYLTSNLKVAALKVGVTVSSDRALSRGSVTD